MTTNDFLDIPTMVLAASKRPASHQTSPRAGMMSKQQLKLTQHHGPRAFWWREGTMNHRHGLPSAPTILRKASCPPSKRRRSTSAPAKSNQPRGWLNTTALEAARGYRGQRAMCSDSETVVRSLATPHAHRRSIRQALQHRRGTIGPWGRLNTKHQAYKEHKRRQRAAV